MAASVKISDLISDCQRSCFKRNKNTYLYLRLISGNAQTLLSENVFDILRRKMYLMY